MTEGEIIEVGDQSGVVEAHMVELVDGLTLRETPGEEVSLVDTEDDAEALVDKEGALVTLPVAVTLGDTDAVEHNVNSGEGVSVPPALLEIEVEGVALTELQGEEEKEGEGELEGHGVLLTLPDWAIEGEEDVVGVEDWVRLGHSEGVAVAVAVESRVLLVVDEGHGDTDSVLVSLAYEDSVNEAEEVGVEDGVEEGQGVPVTEKDASGETLGEGQEEGDGDKEGVKLLLVETAGVELTVGHWEPVLEKEAEDETEREGLSEGEELADKVARGEVVS